ncbi:LPS export ABC transporter permease LptG [Tabrizicola sp. TH137]|uniref:LPS export ABC transporter permease LptG n=1 Tax=Tabrizicola sp. TH137 TaxID=2067452 RepID=UPI000C7C513B|nr:LPS export ABC transporter permease LptG [Tabrizicola sp. TH137]PLL13425.1 LPS export ABC transporter permease LptG [Tabrizicola sp. TH137]
MTLSFYIARRFFTTFLVVLAIFFGVMLLIDVIDQLRQLSGQESGLASALRLAVLNVPESLYRILPLITVLAAVALFMNLARTSELVIIRAAGRSGLRFLVAPIIVSLLCGMLAVAVFNPLVAATTNRYEITRAQLTGSGESRLSISSTGLWLRQGGANGQTVIQAARANAFGTELLDVTFLLYGPDGKPETRIEAESARLEPGAWVVSGAMRWPLSESNPASRVEAMPEGSRIDSDLTAEGIRDSFGTPAEIAFWALPEYIQGLDRAGFSSLAHRVWFQMELAQPLLLAAMVLVAAGFTMRPARFGRTGILVLLAILSGFLIFFLRNFAQVLGANGQIPVIWAAWTPPVAAFMMALGLLLHVEDG